MRLLRDDGLVESRRESVLLDERSPPPVSAEEEIRKAFNAMSRSRGCEWAFTEKGQEWLTQHERKTIG